MTEEECSENLDLQKEIGVIFQPGGKGQVNLSSSLERVKWKGIDEKKIMMRFGFVSINVLLSYRHCNGENCNYSFSHTPLLEVPNRN